jgi:hypothetical protein
VKKNLFGLLVIAQAGMLMHAGCNIQKPFTATPSGHDTLYTTIVRHLSTQKSWDLYRLVSQKTADSFDTVCSDTAPPTPNLVRFGSTGNCGGLITTFSIKCSISFDTLYRMVDDPMSQDTMNIVDTVTISNVAYHDTISCRIDTILAYRKSNRPYFDNKDSITTLLSHPTEGLRQYILLAAFHFDNDSATIKLIDNPTWAQLELMGVSEGYGDCWFYPRCINGVPVATLCTYWIAKRTAISDISDCSKPYLVIAADSTALDSTYRWKVVITNKYAQSDTISVISKVIPFPYHCP